MALIYRPSAIHLKFKIIYFHIYILYKAGATNDSEEKNNKLVLVSKVLIFGKSLNTMS